MSDLLIRNIKPHLKRQLKERARRHGQSLSDEAQSLIQRGLSVSGPEIGMGTWLYSLVDERDRGDDLVFEISNDVVKPPDFE